MNSKRYEIERAIEALEELMEWAMKKNKKKHYETRQRLRGRACYDIL